MHSGRNKSVSAQHLRLGAQVERDMRSAALAHQSNAAMRARAEKLRKGVIVTLPDGKELHYGSLNDCYMLGGFALKGVKDCCNGLRDDMRGVKFRWSKKG